MKAKTKKLQLTTKSDSKQAETSMNRADIAHVF